MPPLSRIYAAECWKIARRPMTKTLVVILVAMMVLIYATLIATILVPEGLGNVEVEVDPTMGSSLEEALLLPDGLYMGIGLVQLLVTALVIILAAGVVGSELSWGTVRTMLMAGTGRSQIIAAKILAILTAGLIGMLIGMMLAIAGSIITGMLTGASVPVGDWINASFFGDALVLIARAMIGITVWGIVAATITLVSRSLAAGLGASLAIFFIGGQISGLLGQLGRVGDWLGKTLPNAGVDAITALNSLSPPGYSTGDWTWITLNVVGWIVGLVVIAIITFRRMDTLAAGS
jgi:ABC-2 type transport system permease protein